MHFSKMFAAGAFMASTAVASLTAVQIAANINVLTKKSRALYGPANTIDVSAAASVSATGSPIVTVVGGFADIVNAVTVTLGDLEGSATITVDAEAKIVLEAFTDFVDTNKDLIDIIIGKTTNVHAEVDASISHSVSTTLRGFDQTVDNLTLKLVNIVEPSAGAIQIQANVLGQSLSVCIDKLNLIAL